MAKSSIKNNRNAYNGIENILFKKWNAAVTLIDDYTANNLDGLLRLIKRLVCDKIYDVSLADAKFGAYDEKIYEHYNKLIRCYTGIADIYNKNALAFSDVQIKNIYDGLYSIIISRIRLFEESGTGKLSQAEANPVAAEKEEIVAQWLKSFEKAFDGIHYKFKTENQREIIYRAKKTYIESMKLSDGINAINEICKEIEKVCFEDFYNIYCNTLNNAVDELNDFEKRKSMAYYFDILNEEYQILSAIIKVQAGVLESYVTNGSENEETASVVSEMLKILREAYQYFGKEVSDILLSLKTARERKHDTDTVSVEGIDVFSKELHHHINGEAFMSISVFESLAFKFNEYSAIFKKSLEKEITAILERALQKNNYVKEYYEIKKVFSQAVIMADEMNAVFKCILEYYNNEENKQSLMDSENVEIIKGVAETIEIKIQSIDENKNDFKEASEKQFNSYSERKSSIEKSDAEKDAIKNQVDICCNNLINDLISLAKDDRRGVTLIRRALNDAGSCELVRLYNENLEKATERKIEDSVKKTNRFITDYLLFEMTTFEEVINYSVSILKAGQNEDVVSFANFIYEQADALNNILKINNIITIRPKPHEMFNGKEHEVLMAEKNEEYKKGEIIKVMNSGYKRGDIVLLRANVIAAK